MARATQPRSSEALVLQRWLLSVNRFAAANLAESRISQFIQELFPRRYIRSLESAPYDGGLFLEDCFGPQDLTLERHRYLANRTQPAEYIPVEIKAFLPFERTYWPGYIEWGACFKKSADPCGIVILTSPRDSDRVALCPTVALLQHLRPWREDETSMGLFLDGELQSGRFHVPVFPPSIQPYVIPLSFLQRALHNVMDCARNPGTAW